MNAPLIPRPRIRAVPPPPPAECIDDLRELGFVERVTLFISGMKKDNAAQLLEGFSGHQKRRALEFEVSISRWDSPTRQGRLVRELGIRPDALSRLRTLVIEAPVGLRGAICEAIPGKLAAHFPCIKSIEATAPAMRTLAARLVWEAIR